MSKWYVTWYEKKGEELIGEQKIELSISEIRCILGVEANNPLEGCWPIKENSAKQLQEKTGVTIDTMEFDYFIESYR